MSNSFIMTESIVRPAKMPYGRLKDNGFVGIEGEHAARALVVETKDDLSAFASVNLIIDDLDCGAMTKTTSGGTTTLSMTLTSSMIGRSGRKICQLIMVNSGNTVVQKSSQFEAYVGRANEIERSVDDGVTIIILSEAVTEMAREAAAAAAEEAVADVVEDCQAIADAASASADAAAQSASDAQTAAASITVDATLDPTSTHAIQNKAVASEISSIKADLGDSNALDIAGIIYGLSNLGLGLQMVEARKITSKQRYDASGKVVEYTGTATLGVHPPIKNLPAGEYYIYGAQNVFSWVKNCSTGEITNIDSFITNTHTLTVAFEFDVFLTKQDNYNLILATNGATTVSNLAVYNPSGYSFNDSTLTDPAKCANALVTGENIRGTKTSIVAIIDNAFNALDTVSFTSGKYWKNNNLTMANSATWGCYAALMLPSGSYKIANYQTAFSFLKHVETGTVESLSSFVSNEILTINDTCEIYISNNSTTPISEIHTTHTNRYVEVGKYSEFKTIAAAINATQNWDTIFVHSGTYEEQLELWGKPRHLIGECRESTIIIDHSGAYATPPIEMSEGTLSNFTVIEDASNAAEGADLRAYCLHVEWSPIAEHSGLYVNNCTFINEVHSPLGCGMQSDYTVKFENCSFYCNATNEGTWERGSFYFHAKNATDVNNQNIIAENCIIMSAGNYAVYIGTPYQASGGSCRYRFSGCTIWSNNRGTADNCVFIQTDSDTTITKMIDSYGNTVNKLNSTQPHTPEN